MRRSTRRRRCCRQSLQSWRGWGVSESGSLFCWSQNAVGKGGRPGRWHLLPQRSTSTPVQGGGGRITPAALGALLVSLHWWGGKATGLTGLPQARGPFERWGWGGSLKRAAAGGRAGGHFANHSLRGRGSPRKEEAKGPVGVQEGGRGSGGLTVCPVVATRPAPGPALLPCQPGSRSGCPASRSAGACGPSRHGCRCGCCRR